MVDFIETSKIYTATLWWYQFVLGIFDWWRKKQENDAELP